MKDKKKASSFFSLFKKKSKEPPKQEEVQEPASVTGDSFTAINDLIPSTQLSYKASEVTSSDSGEVASNRIATIDKIPTVEVVPTPPEDPVPTPPAVVETMIKSQSNSDKAMTSSSSKRNTFPAPPPPPAPVNKEARRKKKAPPPPQERAVDVIAEPRPKTKTHSEPRPKTVDEKMEVIRRELKKETREPVAIRKSSDNSSECSQLVETQILHYSPHNSLRGGNVISPVPGNQEEEPPKVERRSNILLSEEKHKRKSIPVSYYDGRPKQRVAPAPPPPAPPSPAPPPESPREKKRERAEERKSMVLPPSPTIAPPPTPPAHRPKEPSRAGGHVVKPSPARVEAPTTVQTTMMTEQEADLAKRYEDLKSKFEKWQRLQAEGGSATREAKRLQLELIQENESVMAILRSSYPDKAASSTVNGLATLTKKRPSLSSDTFTPRLSHGLQSPLSIKAPPIFTSGSSVSSASPMTSSPGTSRSVTPKTGSCSSVSPAASIESCDSGMGKAPRIDDSSSKKRVTAVDENSNEVKAKKKTSSATTTEEDRRRAIDRIHEEARDLLRKEQELKKASPAAPINPLAPPPVNNNNNSNMPAKSINITQINHVERPKVIPVDQGAVIKEAERPKAPMTSPPAPPLPATAAPVRITGSRVTQIGVKREEVPRLDRIAPKSPTAKQGNGYAIGSVQRSGTTTVVVKKEETVHSTTVRPSMPSTQKTTVTVKKDSAVPVNKIIVPPIHSPVVTGPVKMPERVVSGSPQQVRKSPVTTVAAASSPAPKLPTLEKRQPDVRTQTSRPFAQQRNEQSSSVTTTVDRIPISYQKRAETAPATPPPPPPPSIPSGFSQKKTVTPVAQSPARPVKLDLSEVVSGGKKTLRKVAPPVERHGITTGKVLESTPSTSSSTPGPSSSTSTGGVPAAPPPPPSEFNHSPSSRPTSVPPPPPPPPPPSQLMAGSPIVSTQQLTAQKGRLKPATPNENPGRGPLDLRDCLMEEIRSRGGVALRKVSAN